jgi:hypothetical protein
MTMEQLLLLLTLAFLIELAFRPRLDYIVDVYRTEGWVVLWYGRRARHYVKLFRFTPKDE